jgi:hypothetical protein
MSCGKQLLLTMHGFADISLLKIPIEIFLDLARAYRWS